MKRNLMILATALMVIVVLTLLILLDPPDDSVKACVDMRSEHVRSLARSAGRSPFHHNRVRHFLHGLLKEGRQAEEADDLDRAVRCYRKAAELAPADQGVLRKLAFVLYAQGKFEGAADAFRTCLQLSPRELLNYTNLILALIRAGRLEEAAAIAALGMEVIPAEQAGPLHFAASQVCIAGNNPDRAQDHLDAARATLGEEQLAAAQAAWNRQLAPPPEGNPPESSDALPPPAP